MAATGRLQNHGGIWPLRRRTPAVSIRSPSQRVVGSAEGTNVAVSPRNIPRGSPLASAASKEAQGDETTNGRRRSWCHCALLFVAAGALALAFRHARPSGGGASSAHDKYNLARRQQRRRRQAPGVDEWNYSTRFPHLGTPEHYKTCGGDRMRPTPARTDAAPSKETSKCAVLVRPDPHGTEGVSLWAANVVMAYFIHRQIADGTCDLYIDFGPGVDVQAALSSSYAQVPPKGFVCRIKENCHLVWTEPSGSAYRHTYQPSAGNDSTAASAGGRTERKDNRMKPQQTQQNHHHQLAAVPFYRFAYNPRYDKLKEEDFRELEKLLLNQNGDREGSPFDLHTGFACAFSSVFQLSPEAARYETKLFTHLLPTLRDPRNLVLGIYVRTGATEGKTSAGAGYEVVEDAEAHIAAATEILDCARKQEARYAKFGGEERGAPKPQRSIKKIVWILVTDSPAARDYVSKEYDGMDVVLPVRDEDDGAADGSTISIPRVVLTTSSTGAHTRPKGASQNEGRIDAQRTEVFASAIIDWMLLGESDLVVGSREYTFGNTAAMRTARPVYHRVLQRNDEGSLVNNACGQGRIVSK
mmetsp:Transcript_32251/g.94949  ORF Transcript_32251/g.94949 Transcript_32251/m.94949 type:complete len:584 (-) Transcript_32251:822-2573(-)